MFGFGATPSAAAQVVSGMREALNQQATQQRLQQSAQATQQHQDLMTQLDLASKGAVPAEVEERTGGSPADPTLGLPASPGFVTRKPNPKAQGEGTVVDTPKGKMYIPTPAELEKSKKLPLDDDNSFVLSATAAQAMNEAGYDKIQPGQRIPMAHAGVVTEAVKEHLKKSALDDTNSVTITQAMADKLAPHGIALKAGARVSLEKAADLKDLVGLAEPKPVIPKSLHFESSTNDRGDVTTAGYDPETGKRTSSDTQKGAGKTRTDEAQHDADVNARFEQRERNKDAQTIDTLNAYEQKQHALRRTYGAILSAKDGDTVTLPSGSQAVMNGGLRASYQAKYDSATELADTYHQQQVNLVSRHTTQPAAATQPATPKAAPAETKGVTITQKPAGSKTATLADINRYMTTKKVTKAQAIKDAVADGYKIAGQ